MFENFETLPLSLNFEGTWERSTVSPHSGQYCLKSAPIGDNQSSVTTLKITGAEQWTFVKFYLRVSCKYWTSRFNLYVNDIPYFQGITGDVPWHYLEFAVGPGERILKWEYIKDKGSGSAGEDAAYIDDIHIFDLNTVDFYADTSRKVVTDYTAGSFHADTKRIVIYDSVNFSVDTKRIVHSATEFNADTKRIVHGATEFYADTKRRFATEPTGVKSISINMAAKTLSDTFELETVHPKNIGDSVVGELLGYAYQFLVESTSLTGDVQKITGMYDVDLLLGTPIKYMIPAASGAVAHIEKIAGALGKSAEVNIDDFKPSHTVATVGATYKNIISSLFGWTSQLPQRQVNVFLRGNKLYAVQRGKETDTVSITGPHTQPTISKKLIRTMWSGGSGTTIGTSVVSSPVPFSGTINFGDCSASYSGGLLTSESFSGGHSSYSYSGDYLSSKTTTTKDAIVHTTYDYASTSSDRILGVETETTTYLDSSGAASGTSVRVTRHAPLGNGFWGTSVEVDGEPAGSSISTGRPGCKASRYYKDVLNRSLGSNYSDGDSSTSLPGTALIDTEFPVSDIATLRELTAAIEWLNGKTEERVTMDVYNHELIDFTKTVTFQGNVYCLEKNTISQNPREIKQSIELVRWY